MAAPRAVAAGEAAATGSGAKEVDEDGFQTVGKTRWRRGGGGGQETDGDGGGRGCADDDLGGANDGASVQADGDDAEAANDAPDPAELRKAWYAEVALVKRLGQQGLSADHPVMVAACSARDAAERAWRDAKDPTPISIRLSRAQAKVDRAIALQAETRTALLDLEREYSSQRAALQVKLEEDAARVRTRRQQLEQVQVEAGADRPRRERREDGKAVKQVHGTICNEVAPAIAALAEQLDTSTPAWRTLNGLLGSLSTSAQLLEGAIGPIATAQAFDIGEECDDEKDGDDSARSESHDLAGGGGFHGEGGGGGHSDYWGHGDSMHATHDHNDDQCMGTGAWWDGPHWQAGTRWHARGHGKWERTSWADTWEEEHCGDGGGAPAAQKGKSEPAGEATAGSGRAEAAAGPAGGIGDDTSTAAAAAAARLQQYHERVARIMDAAINAGVQPITASGEEIHLLDPHQLDAWVAEHLPSAS